MSFSCKICGLGVFSMLTLVVSGQAGAGSIQNPALVASSTAYDNVGVPARTASFGAFADAATTPCNTVDFPLVPCTAPISGQPSSLAQLVTNGGEGSSGALASLTASGNPFGASAAVVMPVSTAIGVNTYEIADLSAQASQSGATGATAVAYAAAWDTVIFSPTAPGTTGTLTWSVSVSKMPGLTASYDDMGFGFACMDEGTNIFQTGLSNSPTCPLIPFSGLSPGTTTMSMTINLNQPLEIYEALAAEAANDPSISSVLVDPGVTLTLPSGVSFTTASGLSGGSSSAGGVPEPAAISLFFLCLAGVGLARSRKPGSRGTRISL